MGSVNATMLPSGNEVYSLPLKMAIEIADLPIDSDVPYLCLFTRGYVTGFSDGLSFAE